MRPSKHNLRHRPRYIHTPRRAEESCAQIRLDLNQVIVFLIKKKKLSGGATVIYRNISAVKLVIAIKRIRNKSLFT